MKKLLFICLIMFFIPILSYSQATLEWASRYNGSGSKGDYSQDIVVDAQGNVFVTGYVVTAANTTDIATLKYNSIGVQQWVAIYNGPRDSVDLAYSIAVDSSGNVYVAGQSTGIGSRRDFTLIKYNSSGVQQWVKRLNGIYNNDDMAEDVAVDQQGNVYVTGYLNDGSPTYTGYLTIKYDPSGTELWSKTYNGTGLTDQAKFIEIDAAGNVYVTGESAYGTGNNSPDYLTIKYTSTGVQQWVARTGLSYHYEEVSGLVVDQQGNVYITGTDSRGIDSLSYLTVKYNSAGVQQWAKNFLGADAQRDIASDIGLDANGNVYVTGSSYRSGQGSNYGTIKYDNNGAFLWASYYLGTGSNSSDQYPHDLEVDADGNVYVAGYDNSIAYTVKYDPNGVQQWRAGYGPTVYDDAFYALTLDGNKNVYMTGPSFGDTTTGFDYATVKFSQSTGIQNISQEIPAKFTLSQNYPNPFNPSTKIKFAIPNSSFVKLAVYDMLGREVSSLVNEQLQPGTYEYEFNAAELNSGTFFYKLSADGFSEIKKMILIK